MGRKDTKAINRAVYQPLVVGNKHGVGIVITTVKPLLNVIFNGVYADDIRREIEVGEDISLMRILCKIQIAHAFVFLCRHRNTSFFCDASILPFFATFFKELFVNSGRRNLSFKDFGQRRKEKISGSKRPTKILDSRRAYSLTTEAQYLRL